MEDEERGLKMIVIVRLRQDTLEHELNRRGVMYDDLYIATDGSIELKVDEKYRAKIRDWYANDDSVLYFSQV